MHLSTYDYRVLNNCNALRAFVRSYVEKRKSGENKSQVSGSDLLSILLEDETVFNGQVERIIDQLLDFFLAGTATVALQS
jgi:cytochrome P450